MSKIFDIRKFLDADIHERIDEPEQMALVEIAYLAMAADGELAAAELEVFADTMASLRGEQGLPEDIKATVAGLVEAHKTAPTPAPEAVAQRLRDLAARLQGQSKRELAYMLVCAMTMADQKTEDAELDFDENLIGALGLTEARAEELLAKVVEAQ